MSLSEELIKISSDPLKYGLANCRTKLKEISLEWDFLKISSDGRYLAGRGVKDSILRIWSLPDGKILHQLKDITPEKIAFSPDGNTAALAVGGKKIIFIHLVSGNIIHEADWQHFFDVESFISLFFKLSTFLYSPDGQFVVLSVNSHNKTANNRHYVFKLYDKTSIYFLEGHTDQITRAIFNDDGNLLVSGSRDKTVHVWSFPDGALQFSLQHSDEIICLAVSSDNRFLAAGCKDNSVQLWDLSNGSLLRKWEKLIRPPYAVAFSPDNQMLVVDNSYSTEGDIQLWSIHDFILQKTLKPGGYIENLYFSQDGERLAVVKLEGAVKIWSLADGEERFSLGKSRDILDYTKVAFDPDLKILARVDTYRINSPLELCWTGIINLFTGYSPESDLEIIKILLKSGI